MSTFITVFSNVHSVYNGMQLITTQKGRKALLNRGYRYFVSRKGKDGEEF